jgi:hypothetical protein
MNNTRRMDPTDLRAGLADKLSGGEAIDAQTFNAACFMLTRALEELQLSVPQAAPLVRSVLRVAGRVVIDTAPGSPPDIWPGTEAMAIEWLGTALGDLGYRLTPLDGDGGPA